MDDSSDFRPSFVKANWSETLRAFLLFGIPLVALAVFASQLAFRELSVKLLAQRLEMVRSEADRIAGIAASLGQGPDGIDFYNIRRHHATLRSLIHERLANRPLMNHVEIVDRFGVRQFIASRDSIALELSPPDRVPFDWPNRRIPSVRVVLGRAEGEVRVGISADPLLQELAAHEHSLRVKVIATVVLAVVVIVVGFFYVLHLLRRNRLLEQSRQSASRASYVGLLASGLAHEIRNPLNSMSMNLQMLEEELQGLHEPELHEFAELLDSNKSEIKRLERLVNNFLAYARPSAPRFESRDLNELVREVLRFMELDFRNSGVELRTELHSMLPHVEIDETQFKQALLNLLVNARQVVGRGGHVILRTRAGSRGDVVLEVEDNGPGIAAEAQTRIFEVFYSSRGGGTGLGLPIARQIVERHAGTIRVRSREGEGATFEIHLPRHQAQPSTDAQEESA